jgi:hypothetical protein
MRRASFSLFAILGTGLVLSTLPLRLSSQESPIADQPAGTIAGATLPDAPLPQPSVAASGDPSQQTSGQQTAQLRMRGRRVRLLRMVRLRVLRIRMLRHRMQRRAQGLARAVPRLSRHLPKTAPQKSQRELADEQLKQQEKQRVMGVMATFNTTRDPNAVPLTPGQKFKLFFKSATDPWPFLLAGVVSSLDQAEQSAGVGPGLGALCTALRLSLLGLLHRQLHRQCGIALTAS